MTYVCFDNDAACAEVPLDRRCAGCPISRPAAADTSSAPKSDTLTKEQVKALAEGVGMRVSHDDQYMRSLGTHGGMNVEDGIAFANAAFALGAAAAEEFSKVVVTKNEAGQIAAVTRQDMEGRILCVIAESAAGQVGALPEARIERTPQDYAMGKADHMAVIGDQLLVSLEALSAAELVLEESGEDDDGAVADARDAVWGRVRALRSGIYEFRKRRDRALAAPSASAPQPVSWEFQHEDTGRMVAVDQWQVDNGFAKANPRLRLVGPLYRHPAPDERSPL